ncbi:PRC-barrel domain-containing protein [Bradyrhizobium ottawaense]|uniref:PRC-barrel domain-containing protein n=1 Tax=Bradyrhizobium ottawaense TaxID=931866 RepID=UPI001FE21910|nr:PRC-barrel domain-containing protein [Bradyrhizobium ottawaense]
MARATAHPDHHCISSEDIQGTEVYGADGKNIGEIDHLIIDKVSGRVAYAVMSFGGFVGLGHSHYPIPWGALTYDTSLEGFRTNITEQQLRDAPEFSDDSWEVEIGKPEPTGIMGRPPTGKGEVAYNAD